MKVWLENRKDMKREIDARTVAMEFAEWNRKNSDLQDYPLARRLGWFLMEYKIEGKKITWDEEGFNEVLHTYMEMER